MCLPAGSQLPPEVLSEACQDEQAMSWDALWSQWQPTCQERADKVAFTSGSAAGQAEWDACVGEFNAAYAQMAANGEACRNVEPGEGELTDVDADCGMTMCVPNDDICVEGCGEDLEPQEYVCDRGDLYVEGDESFCCFDHRDAFVCHQVETTDLDCSPGDQPDPGPDPGPGDPGPDDPTECVDDGVCTPGEAANGSCRDCSANPGDLCGVPCSGACGGGLECIDSGVCWNDGICGGGSSGGGDGGGDNCSCNCAYDPQQGGVVCADSCNGTICSP